MSSAPSRITVVEQGEQQRRAEGIQLLVDEISHAKLDGISPILRTALERGWRQGLRDALSATRKRTEVDIDKTCSRHYFEFLSAVQELLEIRNSTGEIYSSVVEVHKEFSISGEDLVKHLNILDSKKAQNESNLRSLEIIQHCKELSSIMVKAQECITSHNYYVAISYVDHLRAEINNPLSAPILPHIKNKLPKLSNQLLNAARSDLLPWFTFFREKNQLIGSTILRKYAAQVLKHQKIAKSGVENSIGTDGQKVEVLEPSSISLYAIQSKGKSFSPEHWTPLGFMNSTIVPRDFIEAPRVDGCAILDDISLQLGPLHQALHIYAQLNTLDSLGELYREYRNPIISQHLISPNIDESILRNGFENILPDILARICGFFTVEFIIRQQCVDHIGGVLSSAELKSLWKICCGEVDGLCKKYIPSISDPSAILKIKEELLLISETMNDPAMGFSFGFSASMLDITVAIWPHFEKAQLKRIQSMWEEALKKTAYQPVFVESEEMFKTQIKIFGLSDARLEMGPNLQDDIRQTGAAANLDALEDSLRPSITQISQQYISESLFEDGEQDSDSDDFEAVPGPIQNSGADFIPHNLPFSSAIPAVMREVHIFIASFFLFAAHCPQLSPNGPLVCSAIKSALKLVGDTLVTELTKDGAETPLSKACQIAIDASFLAQATSTLGFILADTMSLSQWSDAAETTLHGAIDAAKASLIAVSARSYDFIFELLVARVEDLMSSLCFVNWEPSTLQISAHEEVRQIVEYLRATFMWLTHLPQSVREAAHFTCCTRISSGLIEYILSSKVPRLNILSIAALDMDVVTLESFADGCGISQLRQCFAELKDIIKSLLHPNLLDFADKQVTQRVALFPRLDPTKLAHLVEKMVPTASSVYVGSLPKYDKKALGILSKKLLKK